MEDEFIIYFVKNDLHCYNKTSYYIFMKVCEILNIKPIKFKLCEIINNIRIGYDIYLIPYKIILNKNIVELRYIFCEINVIKYSDLNKAANHVYRHMRYNDYIKFKRFQSFSYKIINYSINDKIIINEDLYLYINKLIINYDSYYAVTIYNKKDIKKLLIDNINYVGNIPIRFKCKRFRIGNFGILTIYRNLIDWLNFCYYHIIFILNKPNKIIIKRNGRYVIRNIFSFTRITELCLDFKHERIVKYLIPMNKLLKFTYKYFIYTRFVNLAKDYEIETNEVKIII